MNFVARAVFESGSNTTNEKRQRHQHGYVLLREILLEAVSNALLSASKKSVSASRDLRIDINPKTGEIRALAKLLVVEDVTNPADEISLSQGAQDQPGRSGRR